LKRAPDALRASQHRALRQLRMLALLVVLLIVAAGAWHERARSRQWRQPLYAAIYPIAADASPTTQRYVAALNAAKFADIDQFFAEQAQRYGMSIDVPLKTRLKSALTEAPPARAPDAGVFGTVAWSLGLRAWAWRHTRSAGEPADIRVFVLYHDPDGNPTVPHSAGLQKGMIGVVHAFARADMDGANDVVIAHEILHTLGATDKYDPASNAPRFPDGYGDAQRSPLYPQPQAELMGGRRMLDANHWEQPESLAEVVIGEASAREIGWSGHAS